jgi:competence ComEA-like helix-hairpin-helix protein
LPEGFYERVKNYIRIETKERYQAYEKPSFHDRPEKKISIVDINGSDTSAFIALPGIGSKLASRITGFRDKLGGFYAVDQIKETYGLQDSVFQKIRPFLQVSGNVKKININTATKDELKTHPYIKWDIANAIVEYRSQHGNFKNLEDLKKIVLINEQGYNRMVNYLSLE